MRNASVLNFLIRYTTLGLSIAFIALITVIWLRPDWFFKPETTVKLLQADAPVASTYQGATTSYAKAVTTAAPAVVNIFSTKIVTQRIPLFDDPVAQHLFGNPAVARQRLERSLGSGVIVSQQGYVLTNNHVIENASEILLALHDGRTAEAKLVGSDPATDLAVLKISLDKLPTITLGNSDKLQIGDVVLAIGNPFGVGQTVTHGIISATGRTDLGINAFENFIQTDAPINPGNSGGALVNAYGQLIGINTAIFSRSGGSQGIGFAIPTSLATQVLKQIIEHGQVIRGWLGLETQDIDPALAQQLGLSETTGAIITAIERGGPADRAGLRPGDLLADINGVKIRDSKQAMYRIVQMQPGQHATLGVIREGQRYAVKATLVQRTS